MRIATLCGVAAVAALCAPAAPWMPDVYANTAKPRERCVKLVEAQDSETTLTFTLDNACKAARECTISWRVTCEGGEPRESSESAVLSVGERRSWTASAAHCGDGAFVIAPPRFACKPLAP